MRLLGLASCVSVIVLGAAAAAAGASSAASPESLYFRLLKSPVNVGLPTGYTAGTVGRGMLSKRAQKFHAVGEVDVIIDNGVAAIDYIVFPSRAAAVADFKDSKSDFHKNTDSQETAPPDLPWPAIIGNSSLTGKDASGNVITNGVTTLSFTPKNVIVQTFTISSDHVGSGDRPATIKLARYALRHLRAVQR